MTLVRFINTKQRLVQANVVNDSDKDKLFNYMFNEWKRETCSTSFENWADELNTCGDYDDEDCEFTREDAIDNFRSMFGPTFNVGTRHADINNYFALQIASAE